MRLFDFIETLNKYFDLIEEFVLTITMPGAKNGEVQ